MKRYLACLIALTVALLAIGSSPVLQEGAQESLYDINHTQPTILPVPVIQPFQ